MGILIVAAILRIVGTISSVKGSPVPRDGKEAFIHYAVIVFWGC